jgi:hypothetical protein
MKKTYLLIAFLLLISRILFAQAAINTDGSPPDPSAGLDVSFTNKGFLPPRVALTAIDAAAPVMAPAVGLLVYNTAVAGTSPNDVKAGYYCWNGTKWIPVTNPEGTTTGDMQYWNGTQWVIVPAGSNGQVLTFNGLPTWRQLSTPCGTSITVNHIAGDVAPVTKTAIYGTVTNIPGEPTKCWITSNLGADHQATAVNDATETSAGWYWQFNRKQGYKQDGTTRTPNTVWITSIIENSDWIAANDPCNTELGTAWRIPTLTEWTNVDESGGWTNYNGPWNSPLKIHAAGSLPWADGSLFNRGTEGVYWSSQQYQNNTSYGRMLTISDNYSSMGTIQVKMYGFSVRCVRNY